MTVERRLYPWVQLIATDTDSSKLAQLCHLLSQSAQQEAEAHSSIY